jgi:hypothetical protein
VVIRHGELDGNDPIETARIQERRLPHVVGCGDGHLIFFGRIDEILPELTAVRPRPQRHALRVASRSLDMRGGRVVAFGHRSEQRLLI